MCNCIECVGDQPEPTAEEIAEYEAREKAVRDVAVWLMERDGSDGDPDELLYDGEPNPGPWGLRWQKWEDEARQVIALATPNVEGNRLPASGAAKQGDKA